MIRLATTGLFGASLILGPAPAKADVIYTWITTSITNFDPVNCGTAKCQAEVTAKLDSYFGSSLGGPDDISFTDAAVAGGTLHIPTMDGCPICTKPPGIANIREFGQGPSRIDLNFTDAPLLSGTIDVTGRDFGYQLTGSGLNWTGIINGDDPFIGMDCAPTSTTPGGCQVTGYWIDPPPSAPTATTVSEPPAIALALALAAPALLRARRKPLANTNA